MRSIVWYIFAIIAIIIVSVVGFLAILMGPTGRAEAVQLPKVRCTPTPTPTEAQEPSPTPTQETGCEGEFCPVETPVPTPTVEIPKPTESPKEEHHDNSSTTNTIVAHPNECNGSIPSAPIATGGQRDNNTTIVVRWFRSTDPVNHYVLEYGPDKNHLVYGVPWISPESDHFEINGVTSPHWWYRITAEGDNFCQSSSEVSDP